MYLWQQPWRSRLSPSRRLCEEDARDGWWCKTLGECQPQSEQTSRRWQLPLPPFAARSRHSCLSFSSWGRPSLCSVQLQIPHLGDVLSLPHFSTRVSSSPWSPWRHMFQQFSPSLTKISSKWCVGTSISISSSKLCKLACDVSFLQLEDGCLHRWVGVCLMTSQCGLSRLFIVFSSGCHVDKRDPRRIDSWSLQFTEWHVWYFPRYLAASAGKILSFGDSSREEIAPPQQGGRSCGVQQGKRVGCNKQRFWGTLSWVSILCVVLGTGICCIELQTIDNCIWRGRDKACGRVIGCD